MNVMKFHDYFIDISVTSREYHGISQWIKPQLLYMDIDLDCYYIWFNPHFGWLNMEYPTCWWVLINASRTEADPLIACGAGDQAVTWRWVQAEKYGDFQPWFSHERLVVAIYPWLMVTLNHEKWRLTKILMVFFNVFFSWFWWSYPLMEVAWLQIQFLKWENDLRMYIQKKARFPMPYYISVHKKWGTP